MLQRCQRGNQRTINEWLNQELQGFVRWTEEETVSVVREERGMSVSRSYSRGWQAPSLQDPHNALQHVHTCTCSIVITMVEPTAIQKEKEITKDAIVNGIQILRLPSRDTRYPPKRCICNREGSGSGGRPHSGLASHATQPWLSSRTRPNS